MKLKLMKKSPKWEFNKIYRIVYVIHGKFHLFPYANHVSLRISMAENRNKQKINSFRIKN
jgi:hypothetical protein